MARHRRGLPPWAREVFAGAGGNILAGSLAVIGGGLGVVAKQAWDLSPWGAGLLSLGVIMFLVAIVYQLVWGDRARARAEARDATDAAMERILSLRDAALDRWERTPGGRVHSASIDKHLEARAKVLAEADNLAKDPFLPPQVAHLITAPLVPPTLHVKEVEDSPGQHEWYRLGMVAYGAHEAAVVYADLRGITWNYAPWLRLGPKKQ